MGNAQIQRLTYKVSERAVRLIYFLKKIAF